MVTAREEVRLLLAASLDIPNQDYDDGLVIMRMIYALADRIDQLERSHD